MAKSKESPRQITDAAATALLTPVVDELVNAPLKVKPRTTHSRPDGFTGDKPGFFRGARIKR